MGYVDDFVSAIENYLNHVCNDEDKIKRFKDKCDDPREIETYMGDLDDMRTTWHSQIIRNMAIIDNVSKSRGLPKVFDYAEEFENCISKLTPNVKDKNAKAKMTERERIKRREMGNFGLYIAASVTVGLDMSDREMRDFASCEDDDVYRRSDDMRQAYYNVKEKLKKSGTKKVSKNMNDMVR